MSLRNNFLRSEYITILLTEVSSGKKRAIEKRVARNYEALFDGAPSSTNKYENMLGEVVDIFEEIDPTNNGKYFNWLSDIIFKDEIFIKKIRSGLMVGLISLLKEDSEKINDMLKTFEDSKANIKREGYSIDINDYESFGELYKLVNKFSDVKPSAPENEEELLSNQYFIKNGHAEVVFNNSERLAIHTKTLDANKFYGCTSNWCTTFPKNFDTYNNNGILIIIIEKKLINTDKDIRRTQLSLFYDADTLTRYQWRDLSDNIFIKELDEIEEYFKDSELKDMESYLSRLSEFEFFDDDDDDDSGGFYPSPSGFSIVNHGLEYTGELHELMGYVDWGNNIDTSFVEEILRGEGNVEINYSPDIKQSYFYITLNDDNLNDISKIIKNLNIDLSNYDKKVEKDIDTLIEIIEDYDIDGLKLALSRAYRQAEESAMNDEYYKNFIKHIEDSLRLYDNGWENGNYHAKIDIYVGAENDIVDKIFGTKEIEEILEELTYEASKYYSPRDVYGNIDDALVNEYLSEELYDEYSEIIKQ